MAQHTHDVYDTGKCFEINGLSRFIKETSSTKLVLVQGDHKSEVVTFQMPRYIDGHDMLLCNKIRVHYINIETGTNNKSADIYEVTDLALCEECEDILTFTWTVEAPATKYYGPLSFLIKFECTEGENILYQWNTAKYVGVNVLSGIDNSEDFVDKYSNVLEEWYNKLTGGADSFEELTEQSLNTIQDETDAAIDVIKKCSDDTYQEFAIAADARAKRVLEDMPESYDALNESVIDMKKMWEHGTNLVDNKTRMIYMNGNLTDEDITVDVEENGVLTINGSVEKDTLLCLTNEEYDRFLHHCYYTVLSDIKDFSGSNTTSLEAGFFMWGHSNGNYYYKNLTPVNITPEFSKERVLLLKQNDGAFFYDRYEVLFGVLLKAGTTFDGFQIRVWCVEDGDSEVYEPFWYHLKELDDYVKRGETGLNNTAISLLISILRNAIYESDQSSIITALETTLKEGGSSGGDMPDIPDEPNIPVEPDKTYYSVLVTKTNCTVNSSATYIEEGGVYVAQITPDDGYTLDTVTVTMGGKDVTNTAYSDGSISVSNVTGEIVVVATAIETPNDLVYSANWNYGKRQYSATASQDNIAWTSSDWIDVTEGQVLTATLLKTSEIEGKKYEWNAENMAFDVVFKDTSGKGVSSVIPSAYMNLREGDDYPSTQQIIVPSGAVSMCFALSSRRSYMDGTTLTAFISESLYGRPVWWSLILKDGGEA